LVITEFTSDKVEGANYSDPFDPAQAQGFYSEKPGKENAA
jgi:hypothetical protein